VGIDSVGVDIRWTPPSWGRLCLAPGIVGGMPDGPHPESPALFVQTCWMNRKHIECFVGVGD